MTTTKTVSIKEASTTLGISSAYLRALIRSGKVKTEKVPLGPQSGVWKHMIPETEVERLKLRKEEADKKRNQYVLYVQEEEVEELRSVLAKSSMPQLVERVQKRVIPNTYRERKRKNIKRLIDASNRQ